MFHAEWILGRASARPDPARLRRPALLSRALAGKPIEPVWPLPGELRRLPGRYPGDGAKLDAMSDLFAVPAAVGQPGSDTWALTVATLDAPTVAIPFDDEHSTVRLVKVFAEGEQLTVVRLDMRRLDQGRHQPAQAELAAAEIFEEERAVATEFLRETLEDAYLQMDPNFRDRVIRADGEPEPKVVLIAGLRDVHPHASAVAATFGMAVRFLQDNIARDVPRLQREIEPLGSLLAAVVLWERERSQRLAFVGDLIARSVGRALPRLHAHTDPSEQLRLEIRALLTEADAGTFEPAGAATIYTCDKCQPGIAKAVSEAQLSVTTEAADEDGQCLCGGHTLHSLALGLQLALQLTDVTSLLIVGWQDNFDEATGAVTIAEVRHLRNAGAADGAARNAHLAVVVSGSQMGHSESGPYIEALEKHGVTTLTTARNQLSDVVKILIEYAVTKNPKLRPE